MRTNRCVAALVGAAFMLGACAGGADEAEPSEAQAASPATADAGSDAPTTPSAPSATTQPAPSATTQPAPSATTQPASVNGSPIVPASSVDLSAVPSETAIVVIGDDALIYSVEGEGRRKCFAVIDEIVILGKFVDESGEVMQTDGIDTGDFHLRRGEDDEIGLIVGDGINGRALVAGSTSIEGIDASAGTIDAIDIDDGVIRGSAMAVDLLAEDGTTVQVEFGVNCR